MALVDFDALEIELGTGPMRFSTREERPISDQIAALSESERECFDTLKQKWQNKKPDEADVFTDEMYLRFARCSPGKHKFKAEASWKVMKKFDQRYLSLRATSLESQLMSKTLFSVPGLRTKDGAHDVFYMYPARYFPAKTSTKQIIDNLAYCMQTMCERENACTEGIGFMAYMKDWKMENFSVNYCYQFMMMLQGRVPVRVRMFLIVNPPSWFGTIWNIMKPMLAADFRKKVHVIKEDKLHEYLQEGFETYLPDDTELGQVDTSDIVKDFVTYRKRVEQKE